MHRPHSLRWHLAQVLLAGILPIGVFAAALLFMHWQAQEAQRRALQMEATRLLGNALDNALESSVQRLAILARQWSARPGSDAELYEAARSALAGSPDWETMLAFKASGEGIFRTDHPFTAPLPHMRLREYSATALKENRPTISPLFVSDATGMPVVRVAHPVSRDGVVSHVLIATLKLRWFDELLKRHEPAVGGIGGIFDPNRKFVARSHDGDARRGLDPAQELLADMKAKDEGLGRYGSLDNTSVYTSWTRTRHGWWVALATPAAPIDGAFWRHLVLLAGILAALLAAGLAFAAVKGRRITSSLDVLKGRAADLAQGRALAPAPRSHVVEVDELQRALDEAAALLVAAQEERDGLLRAEQQARASAERANRAKDEFLAMLGHELRNPLAAVSNAATVLRSAQCTPAQRDFASGVIERQAAHLKRLIDDLLDVGRVMTGKIRLERRALELQASARHVVSTLQTAGTLARHRVSVQSSPVWVQGDQTRVEQVLTNLLVNAATYTPPEGEIRVEVAERDGAAVLRVSDDGQGIRAEHLEHLFELFFQAEPGGARTHGGLGIGLTLVRRLVELHGGQVSAQSDGPGKGAAFTVTLPAIAAPASAREKSREATGRAQTVLLVEDNPDERESLRMALELHGHRVLHAADAGAALDLIEGGRPSVALIDIGLPGVDGYALARQVRRRFDGSAPVLIALTGYGSEDDARRAKEAGFVRHLTKPVPVAELAAIVSRTVS